MNDVVSYCHYHLCRAIHHRDDHLGRKSRNQSQTLSSVEFRCRTGQVAAHPRSHSRTDDHGRQ